MVAGSLFCEAAKARWLAARAEVFVGGEGVGVGEGALEEGLGFDEVVEVDEGVGAVVEEGWVGGEAVMRVA